MMGTDNTIKEEILPASKAMATMGETTTATDMEGAAGVIDGTTQQQAVPHPQGTNLRAGTRTYRIILPSITPVLTTTRISNMP